MRRVIRILVTTFMTLSISFVYSTGMAQSVTGTDTLPRHIDTVVYKPVDTALRIKNLNPYFTLHVDSVLQYQLEINKKQSDFYWFLRNTPIGVRINKDNGLLNVKLEKSYFLSGKLKYDYEYKVALGVQSLTDPKEKIDTSFTIVFYNTDIIPSKVKTVGKRYFIYR